MERPQSNEFEDSSQFHEVAYHVLERLSVGIAITQQGTVVYCNEAFSSMTALNPMSLLGEPHPFLVAKLVTESAAATVRDYLEEPAPAAPLRVDYVRGDGLSAWNEIQLCRERDYITWMHRDITQQVGTHELWQRYEFLLDTSQQFMALVNRDRAYELVNRSFAYAFGTTPEEVNGASAATVWGKVSYSAVVAPHLETCFQGEEVYVKHWVELPAYGRRYLDMIYTPYKNEDDEVIHAVFVAWDVTAEKVATDAVHDINRQLEQRVAERTAELQDTLRELEAFNYTIAHDLRSPLAFLKSFAQMLEERTENAFDDTAGYYVSMISKGVAEMQLMLERLLDFARLGRRPLRFTRCDLNTVVASASETIAAPGTDILIGTLPPCQGDESLLKQVFVNLLQNAVKFSRQTPAPAIHVETVDAGDGMVGVCVRDNGPGFPMSHAEAIFSPFKQLHSHDEDSGSGLGLAIVRRIVERHGGRVWAESDEGQGARFFVVLRACNGPVEQEGP